MLGVIAAITASIVAAPGLGGAAAKAKTFILLVPAVPNALDSAALEGKPHYDLLPNYGGTLVRYKYLDPAAGKIQSPFQVDPFLAKSWKLNRDGSYTFQLRGNAKSQYGNELTAEDVKWSFERSGAIDPTGRFLMGTINLDKANPVTIINRKTVKLNMSAPSSIALGILCYTVGFNIFDSTEMKKHATPEDPWARNWLKTNSASFSAYYVSGFQPAQQIFLKANPGFFGGTPYFSQVLIRQVPDPSARLQLMLAGQASQTLYLDYASFQRAKAAPNLKVISGPDTNMDSLLLNTKYEPFSKVSVRKGVSMALDRDAIVKSVYLGFAKPALYQVASGFSVPWKMPAVKHNPAEAKRLFAEAGYPSGFSFTLAVDPSRGAHNVALAELIKAQLAAVGVNVTIDVYASPAEFESKGRAFRHHAMLRTDRPAVAETAYKSAIFNRCTSANQYIGWCDPKLEALLNAAFATAPGPRNNRVVTSILKYMYENQIAVPVAETNNDKVFKKNIVGWSGNPIGSTYPDQLKEG